MTILLLVHIITMITSLLATMYMVGATVTSQSVRSSFVRSNLVITLLGLTSGFLLMMNHALDARCAVLVTYLVVFAGAYAYVRRKSQTLQTAK